MKTLLLLLATATAADAFAFSRTSPRIAPPVAVLRAANARATPDAGDLPPPAAPQAASSSSQASRRKVRAVTGRATACAAASGCLASPSLRPAAALAAAAKPAAAAVPVTDRTLAPVTAAAWVAAHPLGSKPELVVGLDGEVRFSCRCNALAPLRGW